MTATMNDDAFLPSLERGRRRQEGGSRRWRNGERRRRRRDLSLVKSGRNTLSLPRVRSSSSPKSLGDPSELTTPRPA
ncbi:hypothetical protein EUGRSUZ_B00309 [Eucalyptus grandis]|uniref:Uncharacterized protein n=2 Tax=Eucalyptus grandis TaxID=71139 RepID=A0ACC3LMC3_EUCGR|nr:hypothetical protein EUGRSUZ_B00309 [Eucalyptus grandis]